MVLGLSLLEVFIHQFALEVTTVNPLFAVLVALGLEIRGVSSHPVGAEVGVPLAAVADLAHGLQAWVHQPPPSL